MFSEKMMPHFSDTDALGHINNTKPPVWFEGGREPVFKLFIPDLDLKNWQLIIAKIEEDNLIGRFVKPSLNRIMDFQAEKNSSRFNSSIGPESNISGNWETAFSPDSEDDKYIAKGIFNQKGNMVTGTFRTTTGDYRYLEGELNGNELKLSTFDGAHAFLFTAEVTDSTMAGTFYSGNHWKEPFMAKRNDAFELPDANQLTFLKEGYDSVSFSFPDEKGNKVSFTDKRFTLYL